MAIRKLVKHVSTGPAPDQNSTEEISSGWDDTNPVAMAQARSAARRAAMNDFEALTVTRFTPLHRVALIFENEVLFVEESCVRTHPDGAHCRGTSIRYEFVGR